VAAYHAADGSGNSVVDIDDFRVWKSFYGRTVPVIGSGGGSLVAESSLQGGGEEITAAPKGYPASSGSLTANVSVACEFTPPPTPPHQGEGDNPSAVFIGGEGENPRGALDVRSEVGRYAGAKTLTPGPSPGGRGEQDVRGEALLALFERERMAVPFDAKCGDEFEISRESEDVESEAAIEGVDAVFDLLAAGI
jgi:hypothetical protein